jgi:hypothetical protein
MIQGKLLSNCLSVKKREQIKKNSEFFNPKAGTYYVLLDLDDPEFGKSEEKTFKKKDEQGNVISETKPRLMWMYTLYDITPSTGNPDKKLPWWVGSPNSAQIDSCVEEGFKKLKSREKEQRSMTPNIL